MNAPLPIQEYMIKMKNIQKNILEYIESDDSEKLDEIIQYFKDQKINQNTSELKETLHLISKISENHHRSNSIEKMEKILNFFSLREQKIFSNYELFTIFKDNKRLLLYLFENGIVHTDSTIYKIFKEEKYKNLFYLEYFYDQFRPFIKIKGKVTINKDDKIDFKEKRKIGENSCHICELIRNDLIDDFIIYVNKTNLSLNREIPPSIFETNRFLINKTPKLIEYAAFFGSWQIFQYLRLNNVDLNPSLWLYVIHGGNPELIHFLEENKISPPNYENYKKNNNNEKYDKKNKKNVDYLKLEQYYFCYKEAVKCHHNEIANYIKNNLFNDTNECFDISIYCKAFNFELIPSSFVNESNFGIFCKYDYISFVENLLKFTKIDITKIYRKININDFECNFIIIIFF